MEMEVLNPGMVIFIYLNNLVCIFNNVTWLNWITFLKISNYRQLI